LESYTCEDPSYLPAAGPAETGDLSPYQSKKPPSISAGGTTGRKNKCTSSWELLTSIIRFSTTAERNHSSEFSF